MTPDVVEQRRAIRAVLSLQPGERVLDIGSGPGFLAAEMAAEVGPDGRVHGIDPSESMLASARRRDDARRVRHRRCAGVAVPGRAVRRRRMHSGVRVRRGHRGGAGRGAAGAAPRRPAARAGHRLGLDRLALERPRADGSGCSPPGTSTSPTPTCRGGCPALLRAAGLEPTSPAIIPILNVGADRDTFSAGISRLVAAFVAGRGGSARLRPPPGSRTSLASATTTSSASTATCSWLRGRSGIRMTRQAAEEKGAGLGHGSVVPSAPAI